MDLLADPVDPPQKPRLVVPDCRLSENVPGGVDYIDLRWNQVKGAGPGEICRFIESLPAGAVPGS